MDLEIEVKFLNVDVNVLKNRLKEVGASLIFGEKLMRRKVYDYPDLSLNSKNAWVRVRDEGHQVTMSYKQASDMRSIHGTAEICVTVNSFESTCNFLESIGMKQKAYQETKRELWQIDIVDITIDTWPWVPTFLEIEGPSEELVKQVANKLGFNWEEAVFGPNEVVIKHYYDLTSDEINSYPEIIFGEVPEKIKLKRK